MRIFATAATVDGLVERKSLARGDPLDRGGPRPRLSGESAVVRGPTAPTAPTHHTAGPDRAGGAIVAKALDARPRLAARIRSRT